MTTLVLSTAGAALGSAVGGSVLGLSMTAIGRFAGASLGRALDQRLLGAGSAPVEVGRVDRFRLTGAGEGHPVARVFGRMRVGGHVIWASEFREHMDKQGGGKGGPPQPRTNAYRYSVDLAVALCEGEISGVPRVWADGHELAVKDLNMRIYPGTDTQLPDAAIEATEGAGQAPAYRGTAYVVFEDLDLAAFGNRVPQFNFEVLRPDHSEQEVPALINGVSMIPGSGEYALATQPVYMDYIADADSALSLGKGGLAVANVNSPSDQPDLNTSLELLEQELPNCKAVSLVVSWFGDDLRCNHCQLRPKVEQDEFDGRDMPWQVAGLSRDQAQVVPRLDDRPIYGGTPTDQSVIQAIRHMVSLGHDVMYYPFILMDQQWGNGLPDPWGWSEQPQLPWRGRITGSLAAGQPGSPDGTAQADVEVAAFFGTAQASDFTIGADSVTYSGPEEWSYRRFILHQAALAACAGGVESFCIGSEMRGLTQIRGASGFPAVTQLIALAAQCRQLLGPSVKLSYAADWSEYFGYQPTDGSGDVYFHLDPLWADANIDFVGIDNYMPLSDWREGTDHADAHWGAVYDLEYLQSNIEGGEGYDWYYASQHDRDTQQRAPITDGAYGEPWIYRYKDLRNWWLNPHYERGGGTRSTTPTAWVPQSKPMRFTELGCAAVDLGTNQPNKFLDAKSVESSLAHYSKGIRDEAMQRAYLQAMHSYWGDPARNPVSGVYGAPMLDMAHAYVWAWDARPYPWFPGNHALWSDGPNYQRGHWVNGRGAGRTLASVVREICHAAGLTHIDTRRLHGMVRGYALAQSGDARAALQSLMLAYGFDAIERDGVLRFQSRRDQAAQPIAISDMVHRDGQEDLTQTRANASELSERVRLGFVLADADHQVASSEAALPGAEAQSVAQSDLPLLLSRAQGQAICDRWLSEARVARDTLTFALPPSRLDLGAGDVLRVSCDQGDVLARIDRVEISDLQEIEATRISPDLYIPAPELPESSELSSNAVAVPVQGVFMDLPAWRDTVSAPYLAVSGDPWGGSVAVYDAPEDADYQLNQVIGRPAVMGLSTAVLSQAPVDQPDEGAGLQVRLISGQLQSISEAALAAGGNLMAIGSGQMQGWELLQFRDAQLLPDGSWQLQHLLRGRHGSGSHMADPWPEGSVVVLLNDALVQLDYPSDQLGVARHYRFGPAGRAMDHPSYQHQITTYHGSP